MNCDKSQEFLKRFNENPIRLKRKLTEFSLQLTPTKFSEMINYKKILLENLNPSDIELTVLSDGKEMYNTITDSKMKSLCLLKAKDIINELEYSAKNEGEDKKRVSLDALEDFIKNIDINTFAYGSNVTLNKNFGACTIVLNDNEIKGIKETSGLSFDVLTFNEGFTHTFVFRLELENLNKFALYSAISRGGAKGEKPKVYASAFVDGYYISKEIDNTIYI